MALDFVTPAQVQGTKSKIPFVTPTKDKKPTGPDFTKPKDQEQEFFRDIFGRLAAKAIRFGDACMDAAKDFEARHNGALATANYEKAAGLYKQAVSFAARSEPAVLSEANSKLRLATSSLENMRSKQHELPTITIPQTSVATHDARHLTAISETYTRAVAAAVNSYKSAKTVEDAQRELTSVLFYLRSHNAIPAGKGMDALTEAQRRTITELAIATTWVGATKMKGLLDDLGAFSINAKGEIVTQDGAHKLDELLSGGFASSKIKTAIERFRTYMTVPMEDIIGQNRPAPPEIKKFTPSPLPLSYTILTDPASMSAQLIEGGELNAKGKLLLKNGGYLENRTDLTAKEILAGSETSRTKWLASELALGDLQKAGVIAQNGQDSDGYRNVDTYALTTAAMDTKAYKSLNKEQKEELASVLQTAETMKPFSLNITAAKTGLLYDSNDTLGKKPVELLLEIGAQVTPQARAADAVKTKSAELELQIGALDKQLAPIRAKIDEGEERLANLNKDPTGYNASRITKLKKDLKDWNTSQTTLESQRDGLQKQLDALKKQNPVEVTNPPAAVPKQSASKSQTIGRTDTDYDSKVQ